MYLWLAYENIAWPQLFECMIGVIDLLIFKLNEKRDIIDKFYLRASFDENRLM